MTSAFRFLRRTVFVIALCRLPMLANAQEQESGASASHSSVQGPAVAKEESEPLEANPNRPSSSNSAEVLEPGVLQLEYGFSREWEPAAERQSGIGGEFRFGVWKRLEVRWGGTDFLRISSPVGAEHGYGDHYVSGQFQFLKESKHGPAAAVSYAVSVPTGNSSLGLGSGNTDHSFTFLLSKDIFKFTCDFNAGYQIVGREATSGHDQNGVAILTLQRTLHGPLSAIGEISAESRLGNQAPAFATTLWALTYRLHRRVVVDAAIDVGITTGAPQKRVLFGITYAIANLYRSR